MAVRKLQEMGENLQLIVKRLLANQTLLKLLYYLALCDAVMLIPAKVFK